MKKILLYTFIAAASVFTTSCNDYLDCEPITSVSTNVYLYSETDLAAYTAKFYNDSEDEKMTNMAIFFHLMVLPLII